jgi:predicted dehydrogenase
MTQTRRSFLKSATVAAAAPLILPSTAWGANAPSNRVNLAIVGAGGQGTYIAEYTSGLPDAQFLAVCDCFKERREGMRDSLNEQYDGKVVEAYRDFREVFARDDIDGVIVATPDHWHVHIAMAAARAGKDLYVEKPLSLSLAWALELRNVVSEKGIVFQYGTQQRSQWQFRKACELVRNGYIGEIERVDVWCDDITIDYSDGVTPSFVAPWGSNDPVEPPAGFDYDRWLGPAQVKPYTVDRCTRFGAWHIYDYAIGFIAGWGAHPLDIAQWGLDTDSTSPVSYEGTGKLPQGGLFDTIYGWDVTCKYANGVSMRFMAPDVAKPVVEKYRKWYDHGTTFFGTEGWVNVDRDDILTSDPKLRGVKLKADDVHLRRSKGHPDDFIACIKSREQPLSPLEAAIRSDTISHLSDIAIRLRKPITWDPANERVVGNELAQAMLNRPIRSPWEIENL